MAALRDTQNTAQQVAEAISSVLGMDVTIFDAHMVRIAGTGLHRDSIGQRVAGYSVGQRVLEEKREYVVTDVSQDAACGACPQRGDCLERAQLCCPIMVGAEAVGVISLIAFSPAQQVELVGKQRQLLAFLRKMAELLSAKVLEKGALERVLLLKNQLETVINFIAEGVIAIDDAARVISINEAAQRMLRVPARNALGFALSEVFPGTPVAEVLHTGQEFLAREVQVWHQGRQHHYLISARPMLVDGLVRGVVASFRPAGRAAPAPSPPPPLITFDHIIGASGAMQQVIAEARLAARSRATVLILGESGTGKEIVARAIHSASVNCGGPFVAVNCAAIPETLLESELFGYAEGSFTGAQKGGKPGKFALANGGTLFLDEIGDMPLALQAKMLRVLEDKVVERVGGVQPLPVNVRVIAATNHNLERMVAEGRFREDLYYRLNVFPLRLPPLRERRDDIMPLAEHFARHYAREYGKDWSGFDAAAAQALRRYDWPGNVRELANAMACGIIKMSGPVLAAAQLPARVTAPPAADDAAAAALAAAMARYGSSVAGKTAAARSLGISLATLYRRLRRYGMQKE